MCANVVRREQAVREDTARREGLNAHPANKDR